MRIIKEIIPPFVLTLIKQVDYISKGFRSAKLLSKNKILHNKMKGQSCFILGSGPSIKKVDLSLIRNENIFFLNNFYVHEDFVKLCTGSGNKNYILAPIHPPQTEQEWGDWLKSLDNNTPNEVTFFLGHSYNSLNIKNIISKNRLFITKEKYWYLPYKYFDYKNTKVTKYFNVDKLLYQSMTVSIYALIWAIYMGYERIYLLGLDHDYFLYKDESEMRFYKDAIHQKNEFSRKFGDSFYIDEFLRQYQIFRQYDYINKHSNSSIINITPGGILEVFQRNKYEYLFKSI